MPAGLGLGEGHRSLYDKIHREDILAHAYELARANGGAPGVDHQSFVEIEAAGRDAWLASLRKELSEETYRPQPVRRVLIPKPGGGERPLGIPTIRDRVAQTAAKLVLEPTLEADLEPNAYGYRPQRSAQDAVQKVHEYLCEGYTDVVDADLSQYFRNRFMYRLASNGLMTRPCGVPFPLLPVCFQFPFSSRSATGDSSHIFTRCNTRRSTIRRATHCISSACGMVSKDTTTHYPPSGLRGTGDHHSPASPLPGTIS